MTAEIGQREDVIEFGVVGLYQVSSKLHDQKLDAGDDNRLRIHMPSRGSGVVGVPDVEDRYIDVVGDFQKFNEGIMLDLSFAILTRNIIFYECRCQAHQQSEQMTGSDYHLVLNHLATACLFTASALEYAFLRLMSRHDSAFVPRITSTG